ncbi:hypothetical protein SD457_18855 [Coprobacillaceae bacterium CR2/5/TPMF4]|nr:hypothetical protein SD457_18855 [Coprobacillaceae bacterium CR2/5/TPMF4]
MTLALILNLSGFYNYLSQTPFINVYTSTITQATAPIVGMILFIIGYNLKIKKKHYRHYLNCYQLD